MESVNKHDTIVICNQVTKLGLICEERNEKKKS